MFFLEFLIFSPLFFIFCLLFFPKNSVYLKLFGFCGFNLIFLFVLFLFCVLDVCYSGFQFVSSCGLIWGFNFVYLVGVDGISVSLLLLTSFLLPVCVLSSWSSVQFRVKEFLILLFFVEFCLFNVFCVLDLFFFYIFFEGVLIPMYILIVVWGSRERKVRASFYFFFYTLVTSFFMLFALGLIYYMIGSTNLYCLYFLDLNNWVEVIIWFCIFIAFASKVPVYPLHIWLPEAHVEAPTAGSILLAGVLLKMGVYGMVRFLVPVFFFGTVYWSSFCLCVALIGILYGGLVTIRQVDLKKIIAYSSVCHMNVVVLGVFSNNVVGFEGCIYLMLSHGFISSALFALIGIIYERYHTRVLFYYGGLVFGMPYFSLYFLLFSLCNVAFPGSGNFVGEFAIFLSILKEDIFICILGALGIIFAGVYGMWLYNRVVFGFERESLFLKCDLTRRESFLLFILLLPAIYLGIFPKLLHLYLLGPVLLIFSFF